MRGLYYWTSRQNADTHYSGTSWPGEWTITSNNDTSVTFSKSLTRSEFENMFGDDTSAFEDGCVLISDEVSLVNTTGWKYDISVAISGGGTRYSGVAVADQDIPEANEVASIFRSGGTDSKYICHLCRTTSGNVSTYTNYTHGTLFLTYAVDVSSGTVPDTYPAVSVTITKTAEGVDPVTGTGGNTGGDTPVTPPDNTDIPYWASYTGNEVSGNYAKYQFNPDYVSLPEEFDTSSNAWSTRITLPAGNTYSINAKAYSEEGYDGVLVLSEELYEATVQSDYEDTDYGFITMDWSYDQYAESANEGVICYASGLAETGARSNVLPGTYYLVYIKDATGNEDTDRAYVGISATSTTRTVTVTFNANGGYTPLSTKTATVGSVIGTLPTPSKSNSTFLGWFSAATGGTQYTSSTTVTQTSGFTLYAHWAEAATFEIGSIISYGQGYQTFEELSSGYYYELDINRTDAFAFTDAIKTLKVTRYNTATTASSDINTVLGSDNGTVLLDVDTNNFDDATIAFDSTHTIGGTTGSQTLVVDIELQPGYELCNDNYNSVQSHYPKLSVSNTSGSVTTSGSVSYTYDEDLDARKSASILIPSSAITAGNNTIDFYILPQVVKVNATLDGGSISGDNTAVAYMYYGSSIYDAVAVINNETVAINAPVKSGSTFANYAHYTTGDDFYEGTEYAVDPTMYVEYEDPDLMNYAYIDVVAKWASKTERTVTWAATSSYSCAYDDFSVEGSFTVNAATVSPSATLTYSASVTKNGTAVTGWTFNASTRTVSIPAKTAAGTYVVRVRVTSPETEQYAKVDVQKDVTVIVNKKTVYAYARNGLVYNEGAFELYGLTVTTNAGSYGTATYTGQTSGTVITSYEGDISGVNAGTYSATLHCAANYKFTNGTDNIVVSWVINKANDARVNVQLYTPACDGTPQVIGRVTATHGISTYYIGWMPYEAPDGWEMSHEAYEFAEWSAANTPTLSVANSGTFYVYYAALPDSNHTFADDYDDVDVLEPIVYYVGEVTISSSLRVNTSSGWAVVKELYVKTASGWQKIEPYEYITNTNLSTSKKYKQCTD